LAPNSLMQVKQAIAPMLQQMVQAAGMQLSATDLQTLNEAFIDRGIISISEAEDSGNSLNIEATSLTWSSTVARGVDVENVAVAPAVENVAAAVKPVEENG
jgi:hypothetical protein